MRQNPALIKGKNGQKWGFFDLFLTFLSSPGDSVDGPEELFLIFKFLIRG